MEPYQVLTLKNKSASMWSPWMMSLLTTRHDQEFLPPCTLCALCVRTHRAQTTFFTDIAVLAQGHPLVNEEQQLWCFRSKKLFSELKVCHGRQGDTYLGGTYNDVQRRVTIYNNIQQRAIRWQRCTKTYNNGSSVLGVTAKKKTKVGSQAMYTG